MARGRETDGVEREGLEGVHAFPAGAAPVADGLKANNGSREEGRTTDEEAIPGVLKQGNIWRTR